MKYSFKALVAGLMALEEEHTKLLELLNITNSGYVEEFLEENALETERLSSLLEEQYDIVL